MDICRLIIKNVDNKNPANNRGWTPLHEASWHGALNTCKFIILNIHDKNPADNNGKTPKDYAYTKKLKRLFDKSESNSSESSTESDYENKDCY